MKLTGAVFDFNGTLFFDTPLHLKVWDSIARQLCGSGITQKMLETRYSGMNNVQILQDLVPGKSLDWYNAMSEEKERRYRAAAAAMPGGPHMTPGAAEVMDWLQSHHIPMAMATASIDSNVQFYVSTFGLDRWLSPDRIVYDDGRWPDKIAMYREAVKRLGTGTGVLIFEDSLTGIRCGASLPGARLFVIDSPALRPYYSDYPQIIRAVPDFRGLVPDLEKLF